MPLYTYRCSICGGTQEIRHAMHAWPQPVCPTCNTALYRIITGTPHIRINWKAFDSGDAGLDRLVINRATAGHSTPLSDAAGKRV